MFDSFVTVRVVRMNGVDLNRFQFDFDQTWAVVFCSPDGYVYGRYGTRAGGGEESTTHLSITAFKNAARRALELHRRYPANRAELSGKQPRPLPVRYPEGFSWLARRARQQDARRNCIHCHMVASSLIRYRWERGQLTEQNLFVYPLPENVGMRMDTSDDLIVRQVTDGSPAEKAGIRAGDRVIRLDGQPLVSQADIQWVLHYVRDGEEVSVEVERDGETTSSVLRIPHGPWRRGNIGWRASTWHLRPGMRVEPAGRGLRKLLGVPENKMALRVAMVLRFDNRASSAGIRVGDIIVRVGDRDDLMNEEDFLAYLWLNYGPGDQVPLTLLRGDRVIRTLLTMRWHPPD